MKHDLRIIKTKESLRKALLQILKTKPLERITIAELCREAQINRGTFYLHYQNVLEVFKEYLEVIIDDLRKSYEEPIYKTNYHIQNIRADMIKIFHHVKKHQPFYQIIFDERIPMMYYYLLFDTVRKVMGDSLSSPQLKMETNVDINFLISYQTNAILGLIIEWHRQDYKTTIRQLNEHLLDILTLQGPFRNRKAYSKGENS